MEVRRDMCVAHKTEGTLKIVKVLVSGAGVKHVLENRLARAGVGQGGFGPDLECLAALQEFDACGVQGIPLPFDGGAGFGVKGIQ